MKNNALVIPDCWDDLFYSGDFGRNFGSITIVDNNLSMELIDGLLVSARLKPFFKKTGTYGDVGNCMFLFLNIRFLKMKIYPFLKIGENLKGISSVEYEYVGSYTGKWKNFGFEGYLNSNSILQAFVDFECDAERFELHILDSASVHVR